MKTVSFSIANYCVPCNSHCRHCLLSSCGKATGVDYETGISFANRVLSELAEQRPDLSTNYYIGYCMDTPKLLDYIRYCKEHGYASAKFLQMNGFAFRSESELDRLMESIKDEGVEIVDLTMYGTKEYHDKFAGRKGDYEFVLSMIRSAEKAGLQTLLTFPLMRENLDQIVSLQSVPEVDNADRRLFFMPHSKGRGRTLQDNLITRQDLNHLPESIKNTFDKAKFKTEAQWLEEGAIVEPEQRYLTLVLTPDNIEHYSQMKATDILDELENRDISFLNQIPSAEKLAKMYGRKDNQEVYRFRDLLFRWRQEYIEEKGGTTCNMLEETQDFSIHL